jgi:hypothetical protein
MGKIIVLYILILKEVLHHKSTNCVLMAKDRYVEVLNKVREAKDKQRRKNLRDYQMLMCYDTVNVCVRCCEKLIYPCMEDGSTFLTRIYS